MHINRVLEYLRNNGQQLDTEIAAGMGISLSKVRLSLSSLLVLGEISSCNVTRFNDSKSVEGMLCRVAGTAPQPTPGRKVSSRLETEAEI